MTKQNRIEITYKKTRKFDSLDEIKVKANDTDALSEACEAWLESRVHTVAEALSCRKEPFNIKFAQAYGGWEVRVNVFGITWVAVGRTRESAVESLGYAELAQHWPVRIEYSKTTSIRSRANVEYWADRYQGPDVGLYEACRQWLKNNPLTGAEYLAHNPQSITVKKCISSQKWFACVNTPLASCGAYGLSPCAAMDALMKMEIKE